MWKVLVFTGSRDDVDIFEAPDGDGHGKDKPKCGGVPVFSVVTMAQLAESVGLWIDF